MSWLQRNLFSRKRGSSQASDSEKAAHSATKTVASPSDSGSTGLRHTTEKPAALNYSDGALSDSEEEPETGPEPLDKDIDNVNELFSRLSVAEVRQYDKSLQKHVEKIQHQMRRVASKHYHELIDAADSVVAMDASSANISMKLSSLKAMLDSTVVVDKEGSSRNASKTPTDMQKQKDEKRTKVYSIAAQVKVLVDTPEQIWKALGAQQFLQASLLYMIASEIHKRLCAQSHSSLAASGAGSTFYDDSTDIDPLLAFPVAERQWAAVAPFREQITAKAHSLLESADSISIEASMGAICSIALLEDVDAEVACTVFLTHRGKSLGPLLERMSISGQLSRDATSLTSLLQELLGRLWQILSDYVIIFGVPDDGSAGWQAVRAGEQHARRQFASWMLTTLASICADTDLPVSPCLQPLWHNKAAANNRSSSSSSRAAVSSPAEVSKDTEQASQLQAARRRPDKSSIKSRRRKSSIAGSVLSSTLTVSPLSDALNLDSMRSPVTPIDRTWSRSQSVSTGITGPTGSISTTFIGAHALSDTHQPWNIGAQSTSRISGMFIVAKYLPEEIAQYKPQLARILDSELLQPDSESFNEADEDDIIGLERYLNEPKSLLKVLATQIQPRLERIAASTLNIWWTGIAENTQDAVSRAIDMQVLGVAEAAHMGAALHSWEAADAKEWTRGFSSVAVASNAVLSSVSSDSNTSLHGLLIEPLLQKRARALLFAAIDMALSAPETFLQRAEEPDVLAGHLPWRPLPIESGSIAMKPANMTTALLPAAEQPMSALVADVKGALNFEPAAVSSLRSIISSGLQASWRDGELWWKQISGQAALPEALACAKHFMEQWTAMVDRLEQWGANMTETACAVIASSEQAALSTGASISTLEMPPEVLLCIKGAWAANTLMDVVRNLVNADAPLLRECWQQLGMGVGELTAKLRDVGHSLLTPWFKYLGSSIALAWAEQFEALYYQIPNALRASAAATRGDIVEAWMTASQQASSTQLAWTTRYATLHRIATTMSREAASMRSDRTPSTAIRCLANKHRMRMQAVGGLGVLSCSGDAEMGRHVGQAFAHAMSAIVAARQQKADSTAAAEWDAEQLSVDIGFMLQQLGHSGALEQQKEHRCSPSSNNEALFERCYAHLVALANERWP
ncbi:hypothetical protein GGI25_005591 [Coemansia spiralis]|uniref:Conserved oligomeric Golgi complex subunit 1 n=2 Tax=Coemansia TaxID=4863 RepID=A0A9W8KVL0_9FUNG|nr:hypothetical protein BX070DRAFT_253350 [Coemansia spiralis]KAJ1987773.1 hypothetical protein EDC05_005659 [Coemansia umbellata]KAJ2622123.1 hypothetical protein GGI26_003565 [Coemansia sp. RSA 1358]KAJ2671183.1 hypothetical protein GGI25_005591 [Coemansia spiralis]